MCLIGTAYIAPRNVCVKYQKPIFWGIFRDEEGLSRGVSSFWGIFRTVRICLPKRHLYSGAYLELPNRHLYSEAYLETRKV